MVANDEEGNRQSPDDSQRVIADNSSDTNENHEGNIHIDQSRWWFLSTAFPMIAGTLGPVASAFSICSMVEPWRQELIPGENVQDAPSVADPSWLLIIEAIQLLVGVISNLFLLLHMAKRVRFNLALPVTIFGWYASSICRITLTVLIARPLKDLGLAEDTVVWSQSFYYGMWAAILYFVDASLLAITFWGACAAHYGKTLLLTTSGRTLMLQSIMLLIYLLLGAYLFSEIESWDYLDAVYWAVVTLFTVGFGDFHPTTDLGRALLIPFALAGIVSLGLVISSVTNLIIENGSQCVTARIGKRRRERTIKKMLLRGGSDALEPIRDELQIPVTGPDGSRRSEFERRKAEFLLMRRIQKESSTRRRWVAMAISTFSWLILWFLGAYVFQKAEEAYQSWSYFDAFYFCFEAWTTIGYGDLAPVSNAGRSFYVFWSLLALPIMTVLISNASNTVVRVVRDITILVGNITILPNDRAFLRNVKCLISKITFDRLFPDPEPDPSISVSCANDTHEGSIRNMTELRDSYYHDDSRGLATTSLTAGLVSPFTGPRNTDIPSRSTPNADNGVRELATGIDLQLLLTSEIQTVTSHLQESEPHHYTFDQWVWYLRLLGEDEHSPQTHCRANLANDQPSISQDVSSSDLKWSWIGTQSPLLCGQQESEWILNSLINRLRESLLLAKRLQPLNDNTVPEGTAGATFEDM
ncbi:hypothetical protein FOXB_05526 [Fusarium oxysporum f. sp. conglutinans Fo5176]|uniref:Potassium channel domain-containing protein n=1 Tax=Fusarium oxysporum (strain Fo5176) TaxID=660025 RepID=F9FGJ7_FUSOF|nr:hypothetical protein FOXB_05526 [Fusarium oxysporum f. sp. conglutinans Fo5176]KAI8411225.1 hypothetical protein FOFC_07819 [Fusarium oxysporum]